MRKPWGASYCLPVSNEGDGALSELAVAYKLLNGRSAARVVEFFGRRSAGPKRPPFNRPVDSGRAVRGADDGVRLIYPSER